MDFLHSLVISYCLPVENIRLLTYLHIHGVSFRYCFDSLIAKVSLPFPPGSTIIIGANPLIMPFPGAAGHSVASSPGS